MTNERHEKALEAACRAMHECQGAGDADAPLFSPYQNSWDEPDTVRWTQWKESCEEVIKAYLDSMDAAIVPKEAAFDETLNALGWDMNKFLSEGGAVFGGRIFNNMKTFLKTAIEKWISEAPNHFTNGE